MYLEDMKKIDLLILAFFVLALFIPGPKEKIIDDPVPGSFRALELWTMQRAYPDNDIDPSAYMEAFEKTRSLPSAQRSSTTSWQAMGPHNTGGRTLCIAFNPVNGKTIYAGSASGGLWRSYDLGEGTTWHRVETGFPVLGVSSVVIDPNDTNVMYIGTGEVYNLAGAGDSPVLRAQRGTYGIGILKTTDGGSTWSKSLDWTYQQRTGVNMMRMDPTDSDVIWAGTTEGVMKTTDGGLNWVNVMDTLMCTDLVINHEHPDTVFAAFGNFGSIGKGIYRSFDGGQNWTQMSGLPTTFQGKIRLDIYKQDPSIVYASIGNGFDQSNGATWLCRTSDHGDNWTVVSQNDYSRWQGWFAHDVAIHPTDSNYLILVGINVHRSINGGSVQAQVASGSGGLLGTPPIVGPDGGATYVHSDNHDVEFHPLHPDTIYIASDGGIYRSLNGGGGYESVNGGYQTTQFYNGTSSSTLDSNLSMGGLQDNTTVKFSGSKAWTRMIGGDGGWSHIDPYDDDIMYASWQYLRIRVSSDKGNSWLGIDPPGLGDPCVFIAPYRVSHSTPSVIYAGRDKVYKSVNSGTTWNTVNGGQAIDGNPLSCMDVSRTNHNVVMIGTAPYLAPPGVHLTTNGGTSWTDITGNLPNRYPTDIVFDPSDDQIAYITFSGFGSSHVFKTTDRGTTWQDITDSLPDVPHNAIAVDPLYPWHVYVGNDLGVWYSSTGGGNWQLWGTGLPEAVLAIDLHVSPVNRKLRLATHGNGMYQRTLEDSPVGVEELLTEDLKIYPQPFSEYFFVESEKKVANIRMFDISAKEIDVQIDHLDVESHRVYPVDRLSFGTYVLQIIYADGSIERRKISSR
jgi:photosystem II stability/assembly factor-like uncharacterized protein